MFILEEPSDLANGRYSLYVCSYCGDIGCGAITISLKRTQHHFIWRDFAHETYYNQTTQHFSIIENIGPFYFNKTDYLKKINQYTGTIGG